MTATGLRVIGTGYHGKEPLEQTADVLRAVNRLRGEELGYEACLTSRPFTARTLVAERLGAVLPGRGNLPGADRAQLDLADGLAALGTAGFSVERLPPGRLPATTAGRVLIVGPLRVPARWLPGVDQLVLGELWRHLVVEEVAGQDAICLDPVYGGYTSIPLEHLSTESLLVEAGSGGVDGLPRACLLAGAEWRRAGLAAEDRDAPGLLLLAQRSTELLLGSCARRLRLSLANQALQALRWGSLLGWCGPLSTTELALADVFQDTGAESRSAHRAILDKDPTALAASLRTLARLAEATTELSGRLLDGSR